MNNLVKSTNVESVSMTSLELVELINNFRLEEGNSIEKDHKDLMKSIRTEIEALQSLNIEDGGNFSLISYTDKMNRNKPCYKMNKSGIMQMLNKESALVRYKTQQYIEVLEKKLSEPVKPLSAMELLKLQYQAIEEQDQKIEDVNKKLDNKFDNLPLFPTDSKILKKLVNKTVVPLLGGKKSRAYSELSRKVFSDLYKQIHREFGVTGCEEIKRKDLDIAKEIITNYKLPRALELEVNSINQQVSFTQ